MSKIYLGFAGPTPNLQDVTRPMEVRFKVWLETKQGVPLLGDGILFLLCAVNETCSLAEAARVMGMSYRRAWGKIRKAEKRLGCRLIVTYTGGRKGGGTELTLEGRRLVKQYAAFRADVNKAIRALSLQHFGSPTVGAASLTLPAFLAKIKFGAGVAQR